MTAAVSASYLQLGDSLLQMESDLVETGQILLHILQAHHLLLLKGMYLLVQSLQHLVEL